MATKKVANRLRIRRGIRNKISGTATKPRLSVFKSNKSIYAQIIDDTQGVTIAYAASPEIMSEKNATIDVSKSVGQKIAEKAKGAGVETVVFDRGGYRYHGRVKALAEGAREGGLKF